MASIYKRGKTWTVRFSKRVKEWDPDKQAMVSVLKQKSKGGFKTKAEANAYGIKMEAESLSGVDVTKNPTLTDYFKKWYETYKKPGASDATKTKYKFHILIIKKYWGQTRIKDISRSQYQAFINKLAKKYAPVTVQKLNGNLKACMSSAVSDGILTRNFISNVKSHGNEAKKLKVEYLNIEEIQRLIKTTVANLNVNIPSRYMVLTAIYTGARLGEISALHWDDIDFDKKIINITKSYSWATHKIGPTKTKSSVRKIAVNDFLLDKLKELKQNNCDFIFGGATGYPPTSGDVNSVLRSLLKNAYITKDLHFHSLRHVHVAFLLSKHIDISVISKRLGHSNIGTTLNIYAYLIDELKLSEDKKIVSYLDSLTQ